MKRLLAGILAAALMATAGVVGVSAAGRGMQGAQAGARYVDANNDGVCDNRGTGLGAGLGAGCLFTDADGDGVCDTCGRLHCRFVDANNDGVCDNRGTGLGMGRGACGGRGR